MEFCRSAVATFFAVVFTEREVLAPKRVCELCGELCGERVGELCGKLGSAVRQIDEIRVFFIDLNN